MAAKGDSNAAPDNDLRREEGDEARGGPVRLTYWPTNTTNPRRPRTVAAGYDRETQTMRVEWRDGGAAYNYYEITPQEWRNFRRAVSPGRWINRVGNAHPYGPADSGQ